MANAAFIDPPGAWRPLLADVPADTIAALAARVAKARETGVVYPPADLQFSALALPPSQVRVVILGQDPYHGPGQAMGMSFSVPPGVRPPPSLVNIFQEIERQTGRPAAGRSGDLTPWRDQGVLLLNTVLTVGAGQPGSHRNWGWEALTDCLVTGLSQQADALVFMLWGKDAQAKAALVDADRHLVLTSPHPSPFSAQRGFFGNGHFQKANDRLASRGYAPIQW